MEQKVLLRCLYCKPSTAKVLALGEKERKGTQVCIESYQQSNSALYNCIYKLCSITIISLTKWAFTLTFT